MGVSYLQHATAVKKGHADFPRDLFTRLKGIGVRQVRITCGLILFSYILSHFINHALGNISYDAMEEWLLYHKWWWRSLLGTTLLYSAAITHLLLGLWALYQRRHFRFRTAEITQLVLGLSIPLLLTIHLVGVRLNGTLFGRDINYASAFYSYWIARPYVEWVQFTVLIIAWMHACIGLHFWLRLKPFYKSAGPLFLVGAALLPVLALLGLVHGARTVIHLAADPRWVRANVVAAPPDQRAILDEIILYFPIAYLGLIGAVFAARGLRVLRERRLGMFTVSYPDRKVRVPIGLTVLEASLRFKVPHASICGGRARCSTCRIRVVSDRGALPRASPRESFVLARVGVDDPSIRLACQLRPHANVAVIPLLPPNIGPDFVRNRQRVNLGAERYIVSMFVDMRGSTKLAESRLPFDVVFLINRFITAVSQAVIDAGGRPNQILGDGLLALFGLDCDPCTASRQAIRAAALIASNVEYLNHQFAGDLSEPIQFGIGIHGGEVIVGDIGFPNHTVFTALGDPVNVAARLQDMTKSLNCQVIISNDVCSFAGIDSTLLTRTEATIQGRHESVMIYSVTDPTMLPSLLGGVLATAARV